jgi:hypothetical protein
MWTVTLPYYIGTFVKIPANPRYSTKTLFGQIVGFCVFSQTDITVYVSGYKESWGGEFLLREIELMTDEEIKQLEADYNWSDNNESI